MKKEMTTAAVLGRVYHLFDTTTRWTRGTIARDRHGHPTDADVSKAVRWCALGAIMKEGGVGSNVTNQASYELSQTLRLEGWNSIPAANDQPGGYRRIRQALRDTIMRLAPDQPELVAEKVEERELVGAPR